MHQYQYSIAPQKKDQYGFSRDQYVRDLEAGELETLDLGSFQGAMDLAGNTEFAVCYDADGNEVVVYRELL